MIGLFGDQQAKVTGTVRVVEGKAGWIVEECVARLSVLEAFYAGNTCRVRGGWLGGFVGFGGFKQG